MKEQLMKWWEGKVSQWFVNNLNRNQQTRTRKMHLLIDKNFPGYHLHQNPKKSIMASGAKMVSATESLTP